MSYNTELSLVSGAPLLADVRNEACGLSIVIARVGDASVVRRCLNSLAPQIHGRSIEVIVPFDSTQPDIDLLEAQFPTFTFIGMDQVRTMSARGIAEELHAKHDLFLARSLTVAQGDVIAILEDTVAADADWCEQLLEAHRLPYGVIGGAVEHVAESALNWAVYFLDFGRYQLPLREGPAGYLTDINISYKRNVLWSVRPLWGQSYHEVTVNWALARRGVVLWLRPQMVVRQDRGRLRLLPAVRERVAWGEIFGELRCQDVSPGKRVLYLLASPAIPLVLIARIARKVFSSGRNRANLVRSLPYLVVFAVAWCLGEFLSYLPGPRSCPEAEKQSI